MRDAIATVLLVAGVAVQLLALLGVLLMRSALDRLHYAGLTTLAGLLLPAAVLVRDSFSLIGNRAILLAAFSLLTGPALVHMTARAIHRAEQERDR